MVYASSAGGNHSLWRVQCREGECRGARGLRPSTYSKYNAAVSHRKGKYPPRARGGAPPAPRPARPRRRKGPRTSTFPKQSTALSIACATSLLGTGDREGIAPTLRNLAQHLTAAHIRRWPGDHLNTSRTLRAHGSAATTVVDQRALLRKGLGTTTACFEPIRSTRGAVAT